MLERGEDWGMGRYEDMSLTITAIWRPWELERRMCSRKVVFRFLGSRRGVLRGVV
jgi:hypothetical protein